MTRRPAALVAPPLARLIAYVLLAGLGAFEWHRYVRGAPAGRPIAWVAAGAVTVVLVLLAARLRGRWRTVGLIAAPLAGALCAVAASGLPLHYLVPKHWDELGDGLSRGASALNTVKLPYVGREEWVLRTVQVAGAGLCWAAGVLTAWPHGRAPRRCALILLLVLAVSPIVSLGGGQPVIVGLAFAVLTVAFLWLERLARRPGLGLAVVGVAALLIAVPVGHAADRDKPLFDYNAFSEKLSGGAPVTFNWDHTYGPIDWHHDGAEMFRVETSSDSPPYYKAQTLDTFDGTGWTTVVRDDPATLGVANDLPRSGATNPDWDVTYEVSMSRLKTPDVLGAGTTLAVRNPTRPVEPALTAGQWVAQDDRDFSHGDSYTVTARYPTPSPQQLERATTGHDLRRAGSLVMPVAIRDDAENLVPHAPHGISVASTSEADIAFAPFGSQAAPTAEYPQFGANGSGVTALKASYYWPMWQLSQRLKAKAKTPYDYILAVNDYLRSARFSYTEDPKVSSGVPPLEAFLFKTHAGYCQQFSGAMALLLRMGGIPARVAAGFTGGGRRAGTNEWVVRDTDAHSWVEAWFDGIGWVTFDPTPPATPARSQLARIDPPVTGSGSDTRSTRAGGVGRVLPRRPDPAAASSSAAGARESAHDDGPSVVGLVALALVALLLAAGGAFSMRSRRADPLAELELALRRTGRAKTPQTTLRQLEQRLGSSGYLRALQAARYGVGTPPSRADRAAFRRELVLGLGWGRRLRGYYALPPLPPRTLRKRKPS